MKGPSSRSRVDPGLRFSLFLIEKLSITGQKMVATVYERDNSVGQAQFRSVTEMAPRSPFSCVKRSPIQYSFRRWLCKSRNRESVNIT